MRLHLYKRFLFFLLGIILLYAPFALLIRLLIYLTHSPLLPDCHRICLRMPLGWLFQPWMYPVMLKQPMYLIVILILPGIALLWGPLFCGWMCPAGMFPEFLSRLIPARFQLNLMRLPAAPIRYGVLIGIILAPFLGGNVCCAFCNFAHMQSLVSALFGNFTGLVHWASFTLFTFILWLFVLGLFTRGGRGWCNFLCPAGAVMGLVHALGVRLRWSRRIRSDPDKCGRCHRCADICPVGAIRPGPAEINPHLCNICLDCIHGCPTGALSWDRRTPAP